MGSVVELYEALANAPDDRARARVIAAAIERLEERYPHLPDLVTQRHLGEAELRLQKEIAETERRLRKEIEQLRGETGAMELRLVQQIEQLRGETQVAIERSRNLLLMWLVPLMLAQVGAIAALVKRL